MMPVADTTLSNILTVHVGLLVSAEEKGDKRMVVRVLQYLPQVRRKLEGGALTGLVKQSTTPLASQVVSSLNSDGSAEKVSQSSFSEAYLFFLAAIFLLDKKQINEAGNIFLQVTGMIEELNNRTLDPLLARCYSFLGRTAELRGISIHSHLMLAFRQSALRHDMETHAAIYNVFLRSLVQSGQVEEADKLVARSPFPDQVSGASQARFHYYLGNIRAVQAKYAEAKDSLGKALAKAPHGKQATGFLQAVHKLLVVVQLLLGEIPERSLFRTPSLSKSLRPYLPLCQAVRLGDLTRFQQLVSSQEQKFASDRTLILIQRLHQNVLCAGLKRLCQAYTRIPLVEVQRKLCLPTVEDTAFVLLKAIKDGVIEGEINHQEGYLKSAIVPNPYYTTEPQKAFNERIGQMNALHDDCLRAMRYPDGVKKSVTNESAPTEEEMMEEYLDAEDDLAF